MAKRLYFPGSDASAVNPAFGTGGFSWSYTSEALRRKLADTKGTSAVAAGTQVGPWTSGTPALDRQYVSTRMDAGITFTSGSTTVKMQLMLREYANADNITILWVSVRIVSSDGNTLRATLYENNPSVGELINNATHRNQTVIAAGTTLNASYTTVLGDRIVVEFGYSDTGATPEASAKWGENATDLPENNTQTTDGAGWIEFSNTITFAGESNAYTLVVDPATYSFTTQAATLLVARKLVVTNAVYAFTPADAALRRGYKFLVQEAAYAFSTEDATFSITRKLIVTEAIYSFTPETAGLRAARKLVVTEATYSFTPADVSFRKGYNFPVEAAVYSFTTADAAFKANRIFHVDSATYSMTTADAGLKAQRKLVVNNAVYSFTTQDANIISQRKLSVTEASYSFTTQDAGFVYNRRLTVEPAVYSFTTQDAGLKTQRKLPATEAVYLFTAQDAGLVYGQPGSGNFNFPVDPASYSFSTQDATLRIERKLTAGPAIYSFNTEDAALKAARIFQVTEADYDFTTGDADFSLGVFEPTYRLIVVKAKYKFNCKTAKLIGPRRPGLIRVYEGD